MTTEGTVPVDADAAAERADADTAAERAEAAARRRDESTQWQVFVGIGVFVAVIAVVYWFASYEDAGTTMLALSSGLALFFGSFLYVQDRRLQARRRSVDRPVPDTDAATDAVAGGEAVVVEEHYLPETSVWPLGMAIGAALALNGLIIGWPYATPGATLLALAVAGFVAQGRRRG